MFSLLLSSFLFSPCCVYPSPPFCAWFGMFVGWDFDIRLNLQISKSESSSSILFLSLFFCFFLLGGFSIDTIFPISFFVSLHFLLTTPTRLQPRKAGKRVWFSPILIRHILLISIMWQVPILCSHVFVVGKVFKLVFSILSTVSNSLFVTFLFSLLLVFIFEVVYSSFDFRLRSSSWKRQFRVSFRCKCWSYACSPGIFSLFFCSLLSLFFRFSFQFCTAHFSCDFFRWSLFCQRFLSYIFFSSFYILGSPLISPSCFVDQTRETNEA